MRPFNALTDVGREMVEHVPKKRKRKFHDPGLAFKRDGGIKIARGCFLSESHSGLCAVLEFERDLKALLRNPELGGSLFSSGRPSCGGYLRHTADGLLHRHRLDDPLRPGRQRPFVRPIMHDLTRSALPPDRRARDLLFGKAPDAALTQLPARRWQAVEIGELDRIDRVLIGAASRNGVVLIRAEAQFSNERLVGPPGRAGRAEQSIL